VRRCSKNEASNAWPLRLVEVNLLENHKYIPVRENRCHDETEMETKVGNHKQEKDVRRSFSFSFSFPSFFQIMGIYKFLDKKVSM
jgi:hypothetical protein